jgi:hypothetical protein
MESQLCLDVIQKLKLIGFSINWTLLKIGYEGETFLPPQLSINDICQYAENLIENMNFGYELIVGLIIAKEDKDDFIRILETLSKTECVDYSVQERKWRVYLVKNILDTLPVDYLNGLLELTELWVSLGLPEDCPNIIQSRNNSYTPQEYYTQSMYETNIIQNRQWIYDEIKSINLLENLQD